MKVELLQDLERPRGWWLMVGGSEQSFVDIDDPGHLEFEYVQLMSYVIETWHPDRPRLAALHLGGGLCTVPRWIADRYPGSTQRVAEASEEIAELARSLDRFPAFELMVADAQTTLEAAKPGSLDLVVSDVYDGPETVMSVYPLPALAAAREALRADGMYVCNISDASPFALTQTVAATLWELFDDVVLLAEPAVLRGRRSGNMVLAATDGRFDVVGLNRRATGGRLRARVIGGSDLTVFIGDAVAADNEAALPRSGEYEGRRLR